MFERLKADGQTARETSVVPAVGAASARLGATGLQRQPKRSAQVFGSIPRNRKIVRAFADRAHARIAIVTWHSAITVSGRLLLQVLREVGALAVGKRQSDI